MGSIAMGGISWNPLPLFLTPPTVVVRKHVVMSGQQHAAVDVRSTVITLPVVDVVSPSRAGRSVAAGEEASSIPSCENDALAWTEEPLLATRVGWILVHVERHLDGSVSADDALDGSQ